MAGRTQRTVANAAIGHRARATRAAASHLSQLAVTHHLFVSERSTIQTLHNMGIQDVYGLLFYANDSAVDVYELEDWWVKKANAILQKLK